MVLLFEVTRAGLEALFAQFPQLVGRRGTVRTFIGDGRQAPADGQLPGAYEERDGWQCRVSDTCDFSIWVHAAEGIGIICNPGVLEITLADDTPEAKADEVRFFADWTVLPAMARPVPTTMQPSAHPEVS